jgi:hypothetical protein
MHHIYDLLNLKRALCCEEYGFRICNMGNKPVLLTSIAGTYIGGYIPVLFGSASMSGWTVIGGFIGGILGIWLGLKLK